MFKKKKKETAEELKAKLKELEGEPEEELLPEVPKEITEKKKRPNIGLRSPIPEGEFSLSEDEMALAVNALASSEEFRLYRQMVIGGQISQIVAAYNKAVGGKSEVQEDTEELPE